MLYVMRHAQTDWNVLHKLQGRTDIPLNASGRAEAESAREKYRNIHFDVCYSSPLMRAKQTAEIFLDGRSVPIYIDSRLVEMSFGKYEGVRNCFEDDDCPLKALHESPAEYKAAQGAESFDEVFKRAASFIDEVLKPELKSGKNVLVVSHGITCMAIASTVSGTPPLDRLWDIRFNNCEIRMLPTSGDVS